MSLPKNHVSLMQADAVKQVCAPLFKNTEINHFTYTRIYNDGRLLVLVGDAAYHEYFWDRQYSRQHFLRCKEGVNILQPRSSDALCDAQDFFNIDYNIVLTSKKEQYHESVVYATHRGNEKILEFYLNNMDVLNLFVMYFKENASSLIVEAEKELLLSGVSLNEIQSCEGLLTKECLMNQIRPKKYEFVINHHTVFLSRMEFLVLECIARGHTAKIAGKYLGVSHRTVETYIEKIKAKFNCNMKSELLEIFFANFVAAHPVKNTGIELLL